MNRSNQLATSDARVSLPEPHASAPAPIASERTISVVIPSFSDPGRLVELFRNSLDGVIMPKEVICVGGEHTRERVASLERGGFRWGELIAVELSVMTSEDEALKIGLGRATGDVVLTLGGWTEIDPDELKQMLAALDHHDLVVGCLVNPERSLFRRFRTGVFHWLVWKLFGQRFRDLFCRVRLGQRAVFEEAALFGVRQHFIPLLAVWRGFRAAEVEVHAPPKSATAGGRFRFALLGHFRAFIDLLTLFVTLKFLQRPLRFFGFIGMPLLAVGLLVTAWLGAERLLGFGSLSDRPLLILGVLLVVLGIQVIAIGLIGEIIIFTSNRRIKNYEIANLIRRGSPTEL